MKEIIGVCIGITIGTIVASIICRDIAYLYIIVGAWEVPLVLWLGKKTFKRRTK